MLMLFGIAGILLVALALLVFSLVSLALALALISAQVLLLSFRKTRAVGVIAWVCSATGAVIWYVAHGFVTNFGAPVSSVDIAIAAVVGFAWFGSAAAISCGLIAAVIALRRFVSRSHFAGRLRLSGLGSSSKCNT